MELWLPCLVVVAFVALICLVLLCHGLDPLRLVRSTFKIPRLHLSPLSTSGAEKEALLANDRKARTSPSHTLFVLYSYPLWQHILVTFHCFLVGIRFTGKVPLYTDTIAELAECESPREIEEFIKVISMHRLLNSEIKAQHFTQFCRTKLDLKALDVRVIATIIASLQKFAAQNDVAQFIQQCFCAKATHECLALKNEVERHVSIFRVVYHRIRSASIRDAILEHFEVQAYEIRRAGNFVPPIKLVWYCCPPILDTSRPYHRHAVGFSLARLLFCGNVVTLMTRCCQCCSTHGTQSSQSTRESTSSSMKCSGFP